MDGWMDKWIDRQRDRETERQTDSQSDGWMDKRMNELKYMPLVGKHQVLFSKILPVHNIIELHKLSLTVYNISTLIPDG